MKPRGLVIAALVLAILGGVLYWSEHHKTDEESTKTSAHAAPAILTLAQSAVTKLTLQKKGAEPVILVKAKSGDWQITEPQPLNADQTAVSSIVSTLSSLDSDRVIDDHATDLKRYGLDQPSVEIHIDESGNKTQTLLIGDDTPTSGTAYAMLAGNPKVFTTASYNKTSLDKGLNDLRDKRLITAKTEKVSRVELSQKNQDIEFGRGADGWQIVKPQPLRADSSKVDDVVRALTDARMDLTGSGEEDAAAKFSHASPIATAKITDDSGTQVLQIRKDKDQYYAKSSIVDGVYKVDASLGQAVDKSLDDFRNKQIFDFGFDDPNKIDLHIGTNEYVFTRTGDDWSSDGKKVDSQTVEPLVSKLRDLTATKFVDTGFTVLALEAAVTSKDGKRVEEVSIAKSGKDYVAKRQNEPSLYQLDSNAVEELEKAANGVKPVTKPT